jgi:hypothetical protein
MSSSLQFQQQAMLDALFMARADEAMILLREAHVLMPTRFERRGFDAYRSNGQALAQRSLVAAYPVVAALLGEPNFAALACELWVADPPLRGDLARWGDSLGPFIEQVPELNRAEPYLADVARIEWELHRIATFGDADADAGSFALLAKRDPATLTLRLAPGTCCIASNFAAASIVLGHRGDAVTLEAAGERLRAGVAETALVWREEFAPRVRIAQLGEPEFIAALQESRSLADSLQAAPQLDFGAWLAPAVHERLLLGAALLD